MKKALLQMNKELNKRNITYFLTCGTLLGAYRDNRFIKGDGDIDLGCFASDITEKFPETMGSFKKVREFGTLDNGYECTYIDKSDTDIPIDIFLYYPLEDNTGFWSASYGGKCDKSKYKKCRWKNTTFGLTTYTFMETVFKIPTPTDQFLSDSYGKDWNTPKSYTYSEGLENNYYKGLIETDFM